MLGQATSRQQVLDGLQQHGVAPGGRMMMDMESEAAQWANEFGIYVTYRNAKGNDCTRVGPRSRCFCSHPFSEHTFASKRSVYPRCTGCACQAFAFIPQRPEEVGDWWMPRRKGFNVHTWRAKCRCGHGHDEHDPTTRRCRCGCSAFISNFACLVCDMKWEDHETVFENTAERIASGKSVGEAFFPLANDSAVQQLVFPPGGVKGREVASMSTRPSQSIRPAQVRPDQGEKSIRIMAASSGGAITEQETTNRYGRVTHPPPELLYVGGGSAASIGPAPRVPGSAGLQARGVSINGRLGGGSPSAGSSAVQSAVQHPSSAGTEAGAGGTGAGAGSAAGMGAGSVGGGSLGRPLARGIYIALPGTGAAPGKMSSGFKPVYD